jgi:hypothetical protein
VTNPTPIEHLIRMHYPRALSETAFRDHVFRFLATEHPVDVSRVLLAISQCADDVNAVGDANVTVVKQHLTKKLLGPFEMGGLAGIPYSGLTGILTIAHHIPDGGSALIVYGPHIGITDRGELGKLLRPGQQVESAACGSLTRAVQHFASSPDYQPAYDEDDAEQMLLERRLLPYRDQILAAAHPLKTATDILYTLIHELIHRYLCVQKAEFDCEFLALAGGVAINTSPRHADYVDLRHLSMIRLADL